jgi:hypothetical protein
MVANMDDGYLDEDALSIVQHSGPGRPLPSELRHVPIYVEPVVVRCTEGLKPTITAMLEGFAARMLDEYGFAPRDVRVDVDAIVVPGHGAVEPGWALDVHGEQVGAAAHRCADDPPARLERALGRNLWRMVGADDVADLLTFARLESPTTVDRVVPHIIGLDQLLAVTRELLRDLVPVKPYARIIEIMGSAPHQERLRQPLVDRVRLARRRSIVTPLLDARGRLPVIEFAIEAASACCQLHTPVTGSRRVRDQLDTRLLADLENAPHDAAIVSPQWARRDVASVLRELDVEQRVLGSDEIQIAEIPFDVVAFIGRGVHVDVEVPPRPAGPPSPPVQAGNWLNAEVVEIENSYIVDAELLE